ncbi:MAG: hypothetical protein AAFQ42_01780 [Pseudomonadota bacterium]
MTSTFLGTRLHRTLCRVIALVSAATIAGAANLSSTAIAAEEKSKARDWNIANFEKARFAGRIVDILCEVSGGKVCAETCGGGALQLGVVRASDNRLFLAAKNGQPNFAGAVRDLLPYCNKDVVVDGLLTGDGTTQIFQIQLIREAGAKKDAKTSQYTKQWAEDFPDAAKKKGPWFRKDPRITKQIDANGYLGLGAEADRAFAKSELE